MQRDVAEQQLSREEMLALKNKRAGLFIFQLSWILVFVALIIVNLQLRGSYPSWPPPGVERLGIALPTLATLGLMVSGWFVRRGNQALQAGQKAAFLFNWRNMLVLGAAFVAIMAYEWITTPVTSQYGTLFRVMTAFHGFHALVIGLFNWNLFRHADQYGSHNGWMVEAGAKLWYFVVIAWIMFYVVLYWI
jgi:heme/copper-type cytochrome/quinol oxidase subunit 3